MEDFFGTRLVVLNFYRRGWRVWRRLNKSNDFNDTDLTLLYYIINGYLKRAAKLTAINIASAIIKSGTGKSPLHPICINIDGSTYHKTAGFSLLTETYLVEILDPYDIFYRIIQVDNSPIIGAAIAGLIG